MPGACQVRLHVVLDSMYDQHEARVEPSWRVIQSCDLVANLECSVVVELNRKVEYVAEGGANAQVMPSRSPACTPLRKFCPRESSMQQVIKQLQVHIASKVCELRQQPEWWSEVRFLLVSAALSPATLLPSHPHRNTYVPAPVSAFCTARLGRTLRQADSYSDQSRPSLRLY